MNKILLIGNVIYESECYEKLPSVEQDIEKMEEIFGNLNYEVTKHLNLKYTEMMQALEEFEKGISDTDNVIAYYSGHGFHKNGRNFVVACDTRSIVSANVNSEYLEEFYEVVDVEKLTELAQWNVNGNTLIIIDACRSEGVEKTGPLKEAMANTNIAWQLFSTSLGTSSFGNGLFVKAIEKVIYRYKQNISDFFESVRCYMENACREDEYQAPILIYGKRNFELVETLNAKVEERYYSELLKLYLEVSDKLNYYKNPYTDEVIMQVVADINYEFCMPIELMKERVHHISRCFRELGVLDLLIDENMVEMHVFENRISVHGLCANYIFENIGLYDYDTCWDYLQSRASVVNTFQYKYGKIFCINMGPCSLEKMFTLFVKRERNPFSYYIDKYYKNDSNIINELHIALNKIFETNSSFLVVGKRRMNFVSFIHSLLCEKLSHSDTVCELVHLTQMDEVMFPNEKIECGRLFTDAAMFYEFIEKIKRKQYDWIIVPITAYHESTFEKNAREKLLKMEIVAKENQCSLIFYTDFLARAVPRVPITKQALSFAQYIIYLNEDEENRRTYIDVIKPVDEMEMSV